MTLVWSTMNAEQRDLICFWLDELEASPDERFFEQGFDALAPSKFERCCLGVLCEVDPDIERFSAGYRLQGRRWDTDDWDNSDLTTAKIRHAGLSVDFVNDLIQLNDAERATFSQIAARIRDKLYVPEWV